MTRLADDRPEVRRAPLLSRRRTRIALAQSLLAAVLTMAAQQAQAVSCEVSATGVNFGNYDPFSNVDRQSTGNVTVTCLIQTAYTVSLSTGGSGSYAPRSLASGALRLDYNLYTSATLTSVWGNGSGGTSTVGGNASTGNHVIYGRIPARQNVQAGSYSDTITVTVDY